MTPFARPGGGIAGEHCGEITGWMRCSAGCGAEPVPIQHHCDRWDCPVCYEHVASRQAHRIAEQWDGKVEALRRAWGPHLPPPVHYTWSRAQDQKYEPARHDNTRWPARYRAAALRAMKRESVGVLGGVVVVHPWRRKHDDGTTCDMRECTRQHIWVWGPHVHLIGWGRFRKVPSGRDASKWRKYEKRMRGWQYHRIDDVGQRDVYSTAHYQLTHGAIVPGQHAYAWIGVMTPGCLVQARVERMWEDVLCEHCGARMVADSVDRDSNERVERAVMLRRLRYVYRLRSVLRASRSARSGDSQHGCVSLDRYK